MKKNVVLGLFALLFAFASCSFTESKDFETDNKDKLLIDLITYVLEKGHYSPKQLDDAFSIEIYERFIDGLDPLKRYFLEEDLKRFEVYRLDIDDQLKNKELEFFDLVHQTLVRRIEEAKTTYKEVLADPIKFKSKEIEVDYDALVYVNTKKELEERWLDQLSLNLLPAYESKLEKFAREQTVEKDELDKKFLKEAEEEARQELIKTLDEYYTFIDELDRDDYFASFLGAVAETFDPHTSYMAPSDKDRFDISMSGKFEGIGARLQKKPEGTTIVEVISGGPVWRGKLLEVGDQILKVRQEDGEAVDISGMRLDDAIQLIKGPKGTNVFLTVKRVTGVVEEVAVVRDVVELEESYAKSTTIVDENQKFGLINLPKFYVDFEDYSNRNAATDIKLEIERLKEENVEGIILDLRDNGGGSLQTVVDMAGYFIEEGPVVQVKASGNRKEVQEDNDASVLYDGPLVILVNELSASASEILAAAMQDYKRAIILGSSSTYGKGTVQNVIPLSNIIRSNDLGDLGALKLTTQKFYRITGESTQLKGVSSDIVMPDRYAYVDVGERDQDNPLAWDRIQAANFTTWDKQIDFDRVISNSNERLKANEYVSLLEEEAQWIKQQRDDHTATLGLEEYRKEKEELRERTERFKKLNDYDSKLSFSSLKYEEALFTKDSVLREKRNRWHKELARDLYVEEAVNVLKDLKQFTYNRNTVKG
ncbi:MAG: carboxy terminal-processing peptidase [Flavobacteriaceae bacterium]